MAVGLTVRGELTVGSTAELVRGDLHPSGRPSTEQLEAQLEDGEDSEDSDESQDPLLAAVDYDKLALTLAHRSTPHMVALRSLASDRIRAGHGARGPPRT